MVKPHSELPYSAGKEFMDVLALERCPKTSRKSALVKMLPAVRVEHSPAGMLFVSVASEAASCISIVLEGERPRFRRLPLTIDT